MDDPVVLPELLTIGDLGALQERLMGVLKARRVIELDGRPVTAIDTAGLQLLAVLCRDAAARGIAVRWRGASLQLTAAAALLGLTAVLGLEPEMPPEGTDAAACRP